MLLFLFLLPFVFALSVLLFCLSYFLCRYLFIISFYIFLFLFPVPGFKSQNLPVIQSSPPPKEKPWFMWDPHRAWKSSQVSSVLSSLCKLQRNSIGVCESFLSFVFDSVHSITGFTLLCSVHSQLCLGTQSRSSGKDSAPPHQIEWGRPSTRTMPKQHGTPAYGAGDVKFTPAPANKPREKKAGLEARAKSNWVRGGGTAPVPGVGSKNHEMMEQRGQCLLSKFKHLSVHLSTMQVKQRESNVEASKNKSVSKVTCV